ncbi:MAG TPA: hypothetical protein VM121_04145 [Acidimicrobiales bacterium]|nr:hypothetical protein [Acidimicrobiales bacterium]
MNPPTLRVSDEAASERGPTDSLVDDVFGPGVSLVRNAPVCGAHEPSIAPVGAFFAGG